MPKALAYRGDIDFLRGLAILLVVFYHFDLGIAGGFVGVDVFFVISGYLIYGSSLANLRGASDLFNFFRRRIARIVPALFLTISLVIAAARWLVGPYDLMSTISAAVPALLLSANFFFFFTTDYFHSSALNPFLHLWSIAVEEQFYLVFPVILLIFGARRSTIIALAGLSFIAALTCKITEANFYLLPFRLWELCLGAALVGLHNTRVEFRAGAVAILGLILIGIGTALAAVYGFSTLVVTFPCFGAAFLIYAGSSPNPVSSALARNPIQQLGRISYSLYLVHWPVWVFARVWLTRAPSVRESVYLLAFSIAFATLLFLCVEKPVLKFVRHQRAIKAGVFLAFSFFLVFTLYNSIELENRFVTLPTLEKSPLGLEASRVLHADVHSQSYRFGTCMIDVTKGPEKFPAAACLPEAKNKRRIALVGNSMAAHLYPGLKAQLPSGFALGQLTAASCDPLAKGESACAKFFRTVVLSELKKWSPEVVIVAGFVTAHSSVAEIKKGLEELSDEYRPAKILIVGQPSRVTTAIPRDIPLQFFAKDADLSSVRFATQPDPRNDEIAVWARSKRIPFVDLHRFFCDDEEQCLVIKNGRFLIWESSGHMTDEGSKLVADEIFRIVNREIR